MIGKVIEGRYEGAVVLKLPNKNVLYIETEDSTKVALSKNNVISMADVSDQYPSYGRSVKMVMWNDFVTSIILFGAVPSEQNDSIELPDLLTEKENTTEAVSKKKTKNLLWLLPVVGAIAILSIILLQQFPSAQDSNADVPSVPSEVIQVAEELENTTVSAEALLQVEYQKAEELLTQGDFEAAAIAFEALGEYADSSEKVLECKYLSAEELLSQGDYEIAAAAFEELSEYSDSAEMVLKCKYLHAENLMTSKKYSQAAEIYRELGTYSDSKEKLDICNIGVDYEKAMSYKANKQYYDAAVQFYSLQGFEDSREQSFACWRELTNSDSPLLAFDCHVVALQNDGTVVATGRNGEGQINVSGWNNIKAISTTFDRTVGLKADGTVVATGSNFYGETDVSDWTDIVAINASGRPTIGLKSDGTVVAVGYNFDGQCDAVAQWRDIVRIECFYDIIVGWKADGSIVAAGPNTHNLLDIVNWTDVVDISMGSYHAVGLKADGTAVALGGNGRGQCDVDGWTDLAAVYANSTYTIGLKKDGSVLVAGWDKSEAWDISDWTDIVSIDLSGFHAVGLKSDGTVVAAGHDYYGQCNVSGWKNIVAICADSYSTVGLKADGTVVAVGKNDEGQCNVGDWQNIFVAKSKEVPKGTYHNDGETTTAITSVLYDKSGNLLKAGEFLEIYESIVDLAHQRYYSSSVSIKKVENSGLRHNYGFYINGKASSTTIGFTYGGNDTLADGTFDQINIMHYSGSSDESADAFFFISTLMSMATPSVGNVWDSTEIIEDMLNKISSSSSTATYEADGIVYTLGAIAMGGKTMMTFAVKIQ